MSYLVSYTIFGCEAHKDESIRQSFKLSRRTTYYLHKLLHLKVVKFLFPSQNRVIHRITEDSNR